MGQVGIVAVDIPDGAPVEGQGVGGNAIPVRIDVGGLHDVLEVQGGALPKMEVRQAGLRSHLQRELQGARDIDEFRELYDNDKAFTAAERVALKRPIKPGHTRYRGGGVQTTVYLSFGVIRNRLMSQVGILPCGIAYGAAVEPHRIRGKRRSRQARRAARTPDRSAESTRSEQWSVSRDPYRPDRARW